MFKEYAFIKNLADETFLSIVTAIAQFGTDNYMGEVTLNRVPDDCMMNVSYVIACYFAQRYDEGVETDEPDAALQLHTFMPWADRYALVEAFDRRFPRE